MNREAQIYWIIDIIISMAITSIIFQPIQAAFCNFFLFFKKKVKKNYHSLFLKK